MAWTKYVVCTAIHSSVSGGSDAMNGEPPEGPHRRSGSANEGEVRSDERTGPGHRPQEPSPEPHASRLLAGPSGLPWHRSRCLLPELRGGSRHRAQLLLWMPHQGALPRLG